ncbi:hypothetical protein CRE_26983 [Caenorhabditis remanei]|uniref:7TM GPCR serpentine receptor class x (Srx) domain-containing protein n=1 Tax=Caenorhabditis remanei TaxID=31234 RepID=E3LPM0_CAERE|nr:hypothetical protein CRE_26983 [Caenorhabditis remanei]
MSSSLFTSDSYQEMDAFNDGLSLFSASLVLIIGVFGVITNSSILFIFYKEKSEKTAFNLICFFRAASNVVILSATFLSVFFPKIMIGYSIYSASLESFLIHLSLTLYLGNEYQIIMVALNRFCALFLPMYYSILCGFIPTLVILSVIYSFRLGKVLFEHDNHVSTNCYTSFSVEFLSWIYDPNPECEVDDNILEVIFYTFITMSIINVVTFLKIISFYWKRNDGNPMDKEARKRMKRNIILFFQTIFQDSLYLIDLIFTFKLRLLDFTHILHLIATSSSGLSTHRFWTFLSGTLVWEFVHSVDGFIMMMFNERLSFLKKRFHPTPSITNIPSGRQNAVNTTLSIVG